MKRQKGKVIGFWRLYVGACLVAVSVSCNQPIEYPLPPINGMNVTLELRTLKTDEPMFFTYRQENKTVRFFVISTKAGTAAFLDACAACYPRKRGYEFRDGLFTCRACGVTYSANEIQTGMGSCYPIKLKGSVKAGIFLLPISELELHVGKF